MGAVDRIRQNSPNSGKRIAVFSGPKVDEARNEIMKVWLQETDDDYLLMLDTDMVPPEDTIERLLAHDKDIVGGLCFVAGVGSAVRPTLHVVREDKDGKPYIDILYDYPRNQLVKVDATGAACILIKREVAEYMWEARGIKHPMPWFAFGMHNGIKIGEDVSFCLTAAKCGFEVYVDTSLEVPHMKMHAYGEKDYVISLTDESHPYYTHREKVPVYQEILNANGNRDNRQSLSEAAS